MVKRSVKNILKTVGTIFHEIKGISMNPLLYEGDKVEIQVNDEYNLFDVVLFERHKGYYVLHRIINIKDGIYQIIGDNAFYIDNLTKDKILGKMVGYYRGNEYHSIKDKEYSDYLDTFIFSSKENREEVINNCEQFFYKRKKEAYYQLLNLCLFNKCDKNKINILTPNEKSWLVNYAYQKRAAHLLGYLVINKKINLGSTLNKYVITKYNVSVFKYDQSERMMDSLSKLFAKYKIKHAYVKGCELRNRYLIPALRTSNDIDIYVDPKDFELAMKAIKENLPSSEELLTDHDQAFDVGSDQVHVELHHSLSSRLPFDLSYLLENLFDNGEEDKNIPYRYHFSDNINLLYNLTHIAAHLNRGSFWVSSLSDLYYLMYLNKNVDIELLKKARIYDFYILIKDILDGVILNKNLSNEKSIELEKFLFNNSEYINTAFRMANEDSKLKYIWKMLWVPYPIFKKGIPRLAKYPFLLPYYEVKRWIKYLFSKRTRHLLSSQLNRIDNHLGLKEFGLEEYARDEREGHA